MSAFRLVDVLQLGSAVCLVEPALRLLDVLKPEILASSNHEPYANRRGSFMNEATDAQKVLFLTKLLFSYGLSRRSALASLKAQLCSASERNAVRHSDEDALELIALGDCLYVEALGQATLSTALRERLRRADALLINLEGTIGDDGSELAPFQTLRGLGQLAKWNRDRKATAWISRFDESQLADLLRGLPPVIFNLANNHVMDEGEAGLSRTLAALEAIGARGVGVVDGHGYAGTLLELGSRLEGRRPPWRLGIVPLSFGHNHAHELEPNLPFASVPYELPLESLRRERDRLIDLGADTLIASLHWGYEHEHVPRSDQIRCVEQLWRLGFSAIIGHHPHIVQPVVCTRDRAAAFSLGDFVGGDRTIMSRFSCALSLRIQRDTLGVTVETIPLVQSPYWAHPKTSLLSEAPIFERTLWTAVFSSRTGGAATRTASIRQPQYPARAKPAAERMT